MKNLLTLIFLATMFSGCDIQKNHYDISLGDKIHFVPTDFSPTCERLIKALDNNTHGHAGVSVSNPQTFIGLDSLSNLLSSMMQYDILDSNSFDTYQKTCNGLKMITWHKPTTMTMQRFDFEATVGIGNERFNKISITDFYIQQTISPRQIQLRVNDYRIEKLVIDSISYHPLYEDRLVGLDEAERKLDSIKNNCKSNF